MIGTHRDDFELITICTRLYEANNNSGHIEEYSFESSSEYQELMDSLFFCGLAMFLASHQQRLNLRIKKKN
jgi:hypothetical protein